MNTSSLGLGIIKEFEGLKLKAYTCPAGILTIGYGHTGKDVFDGQEITERIATELLKKDVINSENAVNKYCKDLKQCEFDALVSFVYNVGVGNFKSSTLLKKILNKSQKSEIRTELLRWTKAGGFELSGLKRRREREYQLFISC